MGEDDLTLSTFKKEISLFFFTWFCESGGSWLNVNPALISEVKASAPHSLIREFGCWHT